MAKTVPEPENYETKGNFVLIKGTVQGRWKFKTMDKTMKKTGYSLLFCFFHDCISVL